MEHTKSRPKPARKRVILLVVSLLVITTGSIYYYVSANNRSPFPASIRSEAAFPLYYPHPLPAGWTFVANSFYLSQGIAGYRITSSSGSINITIQTVPHNFDFTTLYSKSLANSSLLTTSLGEGAIGKADNSFLVGSLVIGNTWILATPSATAISQPNIQFVLSHLKKV